jgi:hypothetical protein
LINETKAKNGAKMSERSEVIEDELFDALELLDILGDVCNVIEIHLYVCSLEKPGFCHEPPQT